MATGRHRYDSPTTGATAFDAAKGVRGVAAATERPSQANRRQIRSNRTIKAVAL
jgi:hypothetical protein